MKRTITRCLSILLAAVVAFGMIGVSTSKVNAAGKWMVGVPDVIWIGQDDLAIYVFNEDKESRVTKVTSNNSTVLKVRTERWRNEKNKMQTYYFIRAKSAGKATITVKHSKGTIKKTIRVKKYPNHITSLTVNGKKVNISDNKFHYIKGKIKSSKVTVKMNLKSGWKIIDVWGNCWNMNGGDRSFTKSASVVKKGSAISFPKKYSEFELMIAMTNGKDTINYHIRLSRNENP